MRFPDETDEYRGSRNELLAEEIELRRRITWPMHATLDRTPDGRGDFEPSLSYD